MNDADLFAPHFRGPSWAPWKALLAALFGLPMDDDALAIYREHTGRQAAPVRPFSECALIIGRRGGKSRILALIAVYLAAFNDYMRHLAPGEKATIAVICADRKQSRVIMRYVTGLFDNVPMLSGLITDRTQETLTLSNSVIIEVATASFRVTRGYSLAAAICDEVAFWRAEDSANPDVEIYRALRPSMATLPGAMLISASSPYRKRGVLYDSYRKYFGVEGGRVLAWQGASADMNPSLDPEFVAQAYLDDPAAASSELGAQWRDDINDYIQRATVEACVVPGRVSLPRSAGHFAFADLAGGGSDSHCLAIAHRAHDGTAVLDMTCELKGPSSPEAAVVRFAALLKEYGLSKVVGDKYAASWPILRFAEQGVTYEQSLPTKGEIYTNFLPILLSGRVELTDDPRLVSQYCGLERRTQRGGKDSIDHAPGGHDDLANASAGALLLAAGRVSRIEQWIKLAG